MHFKELFIIGNRKNAFLNSFKKTASENIGKAENLSQVTYRVAINNITIIRKKKWCSVNTMTKRPSTRGENYKKKFFFYRVSKIARLFF